MHRFARYVIALATVLGGWPASLEAQSWRDSLRTQLSETIMTATATSDRLRVTRPGTVLEVRADGISASPGADGTFLTTHYRNGQVEQARGLAAAIADKKTNRDLTVGERVYVLDLDVNDNAVRMQLLTLATNQITVNGNTRGTRYKAMLQFDFPRDSLRAMGFERVRDHIASVLRVEGTVDEPKTIELGQTMEQVESVMGKPQSILKVGPKTIYVYPAIKVTFIDGKVTDIQ